MPLDSIELEDAAPAGFLDAAPLIRYKWYFRKKQSPLMDIRSRGFTTKNNKVPTKKEDHQKSIRTARLLASAGKWDEAIHAYGDIEKGSQKLTPEHINHLFNEAAKAAQLNQNNESVELHCRLLSIAPSHSHGLRNFAIVLRRLQDFSGAALFIRRYLNERPDCAHGLNTYGTILTDLGQHEQAIQVFQKALTIEPEYPDANSNLANEYHLQARIDPAFTYSSRALKACTANDGIWLDHLTHLRRVCHFDRLAQVNWWGLLQRMHPTNISSALLQVLVLAETDTDQQQLLRIIRNWGNYQDSLASKYAKLSSMCLPKSPDTPLKIGFVSADFRNHSVARFIWPLFEHLDRKKFELFGYSTYKANDSWRARFDQSATGMRDVGSLSPQELSRTIQSDGIHVLFDLTGFTKGSRTGSFAWRAAPIQVGWLGFPGSSGLPQMDYLFLDRHLTPPDTSLIREQPLISAGTTVCFSQIDEVPITPEIPELVRGHLTIGTLNNSYKITRATLKRWARVMQALPTSKFLFVRREFQSYWLRENILIEFERNGVERSRIHFFNNRLAKRHYLDCYNEIDFTLDTYPVTGGTTTTDALWMGVPVVGLEGPNVHQRVCSAILQHAGHPEWIAHSDDEFLQIALDLAADQERRVQLRQSLRDELKASLLCNTKQFAADFAATMDSLRPTSECRA